MSPEYTSKLKQYPLEPVLLTQPYPVTARDAVTQIAGDLNASREALLVWFRPDR